MRNSDKRSVGEKKGMIIVPITLRRANEFIKEYHRHNKPVRGARLIIGVMKGEELIGVATAGRPVARGLDYRYTAEITRLCVKEGHKNACSLLYARMKRILMMMGYSRVVTYTLERESQSSLKAVGAVPSAALKAREWTCPSRPRDSQRVYSESKIRWSL